MRDFDYIPLSEQMKMQEEEIKRQKEFMANHQVIDATLYKPGHTFTQQEVTMLLKNSWSIDDDKQNRKILNAFKNVYNSYIRTDNTKMINRMVDLFNKYLEPYSGEEHRKKSLFGTFSYKVIDNYGKRFCYIETNKLPRSISNAIINKDKELDGIKVRNKLHLSLNRNKETGLEF